MNSYDKLWTLFWISAATVAIIALFTISSCVKEEGKINQQVKIACIQKGGNWTDLERGTYGCQFK